MTLAVAVEDPVIAPSDPSLNQFNLVPEQRMKWVSNPDW